MSFVRYESLKDVFCTLWMCQRHLLYVMDDSKTSFVRYRCLKDIFCSLWRTQRLFCTLWMSRRPLLYVMDDSKMSFVCYGCLKNVLKTFYVHWVCYNANYTKSLVYQSRVFFCRRVLLSCDELKAQGSWKTTKTDKNRGIPYERTFEVNLNMSYRKTTKHSKWEIFYINLINKSNYTYICLHFIF